MNYDESAIARIYDEARALTPERLRQWRDVLAMDIDCSRISAIVDLGCGTGRFTQLLATHFQAKVIGIDPSRRMIERARQKPIAGNVVFRRTSAEALPLEDRQKGAAGWRPRSVFKFARRITLLRGVSCRAPRVW